MTKEIKVTEEHRERERLSNLAEGCNLDPDKKRFEIARNRERRFLLCIY